MENYESDLMRRYAKEKAEQEHAMEIDRLNGKESLSLKLVMFLGDEALVHSLLLLNCIAIIVLFQFYFTGNFELLVYHKILALLYLVSSIVLSFKEFNFANSHFLSSTVIITVVTFIERILSGINFF